MIRVIVHAYANARNLQSCYYCGLQMSFYYNNSRHVQTVAQETVMVRGEIAYGHLNPPQQKKRERLDFLITRLDLTKLLITQKV